MENTQQVSAKGAGAPEKIDTGAELLKINKAEQDFHRHLTLGIEEKLKSNRMIKDVKLIVRNPVEKTNLACWERKNGVSLPIDLKDYYFSTNGFKLTWALEHAGDLLRIGDMNINALNQLVPIVDSSTVPNSAANSGSNGGGKPCTQSIMEGYYQDQGLSTGGSLNAGNSRKGELRRNESSTYLQISFEELQHTVNSGRANQSSKLAPELTLGPKGKAFVLESVRSGWGRVCLVYPNLKGGNDKDTPEKITSVTKNESAGDKNPTEDKSKADSTSANSYGLEKIAYPSSSTTSCPVNTNNIMLINTGSSLGGDSPKLPAVPPPVVEIWFLDPSFQWHYLAPTFTHYYRMLLIHLGLPQWHYRFTPFGLSAWAEQIFWLVAPHLLQPPKISKFPSLYHDGGLWSTDIPAEAAAPNPTINVLSSQLFRRKKKEKTAQQ